MSLVGKVPSSQGSTIGLVKLRAEAIDIGKAEENNLIHVLKSEA
jgi:hypothetical protein